MKPQYMLLTSSAYMEILCLEDVGSCSITSASFCDQKRKSFCSSSCSYRSAPFCLLRKIQ